MCGDLKHAVRRGVADRPVGAQVFLAELRDDRSAGGVLITEDASNSSLRAQRFNDLRRKGWLGTWEVGPLEIDRGAGDLPVAGLRILARRNLGRTPGSTANPVREIEGGRYASARASACFAETERTQIRNVERAEPDARAVGIEASAPFRDMPQRIATFIAERRGIGGPAHAERIQHDENRAAHANCVSAAGVEHPHVGASRACILAKNSANSAGSRGALV